MSRLDLSKGIERVVKGRAFLLMKDNAERREAAGASLGKAAREFLVV